MKKITLLAVAFVAISLASCKKTHNCECTDYNSDGSVYVTVTYTQAKQTKSKAQETCDSYKTTLAWDKCELK